LLAVPYLLSPLQSSRNFSSTDRMSFFFPLYYSPFGAAKILLQRPITSSSLLQSFKLLLFADHFVYKFSRHASEPLSFLQYQCLCLLFPPVLYICKSPLLRSRRVLRRAPSILASTSLSFFSIPSAPENVSQFRA